jgi:hypothetical protein
MPLIFPPAELPHRQPTHDLVDHHRVQRRVHHGASAARDVPLLDESSWQGDAPLCVLHELPEPVEEESRQGQVGGVRLDVEHIAHLCAVPVGEGDGDPATVAEPLDGGREPAAGQRLELCALRIDDRRIEPDVDLFEFPEYALVEEAAPVLAERRTGPGRPPTPPTERTTGGDQPDEPPF